MAHTEHDIRGRLAHIARVFLVIVLLSALLPLIILWLVAHFCYGVALQLVIWACWCTRGVNVLVVTSNSPNWHDYIDTQILPRLPQSTVVLNWSERRLWARFSLPVMAFWFFGGEREYNPLVVVFRPFRRSRTFRFWRSFRDYKHGNVDRLEKVEHDMFEYLGRSGILTAV